MISIICCFNDQEEMNRRLIQSLKRQDNQDFEFLPIDTVKLGYKSADDALNYGASIAKGDILIFSHQDVELTENDTLSKIQKYCDEEDFAIAGVAGVLMEKKGTLTNIVMDKDRKPAGTPIDKVIEAASIDECFFIIKKEKFTYLKSYSSWHFYSVEYSLRCYTHHERVIILPLKLYHVSPGWSVNTSYWKTLKTIAKEYHQLKYIPTTVSRYRNGITLPLGIFLRKVKRVFLPKGGKKNG